MKKSPLQEVNDRFGSKDDLVTAVRELATEELWLERVNEDKELDRVSNKKLLHLHTVLSEVKEQFGSRQALVDEIASLEDHGKDEDFKTALLRRPTPQLYDLYHSAKRGA